jgi:hypothetical protein
MLARALIVLLLILNLGVALWWVGRAPPAPAPVPQPAAGVELLEMLTAPMGEATASVPPSTPVAPPPATALPAPTVVQAGPPPAPAAPPVCRSLGPFDAAGAARAEAQLRPRVRALAVRQVQAESGRGWRVLMRGQSGREAAAATVSRLEAAGFRDHYVMPAADDGTVAIALGRYSSEAGARRHQQALAAAGFAAEAEPLGDAGPTRYWLDVSVGEEAGLAAVQRASGAQRSEALACGSLAAR